MLPLLSLPVACPACGAAANHPLHVYRNRVRPSEHPWVAFVGCEACGLGFTHPRPSKEEADAYYAEEVEDGWSRGKELDDLDRADRKFEPKRVVARHIW